MIATGMRTATATSSPSRTRSSSCTRTRTALITQREVGVDTDSWEAALKNTLRQAPDVILIGEIREREVMEHAIAFAETATWRSARCTPTTPTRRWTASSTSSPRAAPAAADDLSLTQGGDLAGLLPLREGKGRAAAVEVLLNSPLIPTDIQGRGPRDQGGHEKSRELGMQTFDQALFDLYEAGRISYETRCASPTRPRSASRHQAAGRKRRTRTLAKGIEHSTSSEVPA